MRRYSNRDPSAAAWLMSLLMLALVTAGCGDDSSTGDPCTQQDCSGHGTCDVISGDAVCTCDTGYDGDSCGDCATGYTEDTGGTCVEAESCNDNDPCGDHGTCDDTTGAILCVCDPGYNGQLCQLCYPGYHDDGTGACALDEQCLANTCSAHGTCSDTGGEITCSCDTGYTGASCESCDTDYHRDANENCVADEDCAATDPCGSHGTCVDTSGAIECTCDTGYSGALCNTCYPGYHDDGTGACVLDEQCLTNTCSGHGTCTDTGGVVSCGCDTGYSGASCESCAADYHRDAGEECVADEDCTATDPCGSHGTCVDTMGVIECVCDIGYDGAICDACYAGYHDDGTGACVLDEQCLTNTCSGHGTCAETGGVVSCGCDAGYTGASCESCAADYHRDANEDCVADEDCTVTDPCGSHGTCVDTSGVIECVCDIGYTGALCDACYPGYVVHTLTGLCEVPCQPSIAFRCNGQCTSPTDQQNCGGCGNDCGGLMCLQNGSVFYCGCPTYWPWDDCSGTCVNRETDPNNCGGCGTACDTGAGEICFGGHCVVEDPGCWCTGDPEYLCCSGSCYDWWDLRQNNNNCGGCGVVCTPGSELCVMGNCLSGDGTCGGTCNPNYELCCSGDCLNTFWFEFDDNNCGGCGNVCGTNSHCQEGRCICQQGTEDCGAGCIDIRADEANCGSCGHQCNAGEACVFGTCVPDNPTGCGGSCSGDEFCCTLTVWPWEECVDIQSMQNNVDHCGGCDPCAPGDQCSNGMCVCPYPEGGYCGGVCTDFWTTENCGGCGIQCAQNEQCDWQWMGLECYCPGAECGGVCVNSMYDEQNCNGCGNTCNAGEACVQGHCVVENGTGCAPSCADQGVCCDMGGVDQCLSWWDLASDIDNCGGCGIQCTGGDTCIDGQCGPPPGNDCTTPQVTSEGGQMYFLCQNTASGFVSSTCTTPQDGTQVDRFHVFTIPFDAPSGWMIELMPFALSMPQIEVWAAVPGDYCDNTTQPIGCIDGWGQLMLDMTTYPVGTEIIIYIYNADGTCGGIGGEYDLQIYPN